MADIESALYKRFQRAKEEKRRERAEARAQKAALTREEIATRERVAGPEGRLKAAQAARLEQETALGREYDPQFARAALGERRGALREQQEQRRAYLREERGVDITPTVTRGGVTTRYSAIGRPLGVGGLVGRGRERAEVARPSALEAAGITPEIATEARRAAPAVVKREKKRRRYLEEFYPEMMAGLPAGATAPISAIGLATPYSR